MQKRLPTRCIDINSEYCPCILSETNHCVYCSHLKGEAVCNCDWAGVCILNEKNWQTGHFKKKWDWRTAVSRQDHEVNIQACERITEDVYRLEVPVSPDMANMLDRPGSFVFFRRIEDPDFFKFPVGIMSVNSETIEVVIEVIGPKSKRIFDDVPQKLILRGPYFNGIFGQPWVEKLADGNVLLITGGMGQPPAVPIVKKLRENGNRVTAIIAPGKIGKIFIADILGQFGVETLSLPSLRREGIAKFREYMANKDLLPDLIVSAGPDEQHHSVIHAMQMENVNIPMAATNNATMCCGEGVCGSCDKETRSGTIVRTCKIQTDYLNFI